MADFEYSAAELMAKADAMSGFSTGNVEADLDNRMWWARRDGAKHIQVQRWSAWLRLVVAASVSAVVWWIGAPIGVAIVLTALFVAGAVVATINSWASQLYVLALVAPDQGLYLHAEQLRAIASASELATRYVVDRIGETRGPFRG